MRLPVNLDRAGEAVLIYEGFLLASRRGHVPGVNHIPTVSEMVWRVPILGVIILTWLGLHLWPSPPTAILSPPHSP